MSLWGVGACELEHKYPHRPEKSVRLLELELQVEPIAMDANMILRAGTLNCELPR